jgi:1-acyl-sn-glycerol-3-phosphate acyltransferase
MISLRSIIFNVAFYIVLIALMIVGLPTILRGRHAIFSLARLWAKISLWLLRHICHLEVQFRGLENIPLGGYIIASKHQSFLETFALLVNAPDFAYVLKRELTRIPLFGWYLTVSRQIAIDRSRGKDALTFVTERAGEVLRDGRQIFIFPEGTRRPPGAAPQYKAGVSRLYSETMFPCLPVALNTGLFWPRRSFRRFPGIAVIEYLPVIQSGLSRSKFADQLQTEIEAACARLNADALAYKP